MAPFRSDEMNALYATEKETDEFRTGCALCTCEPERTYEHWKIVRNKFPYDLIADEHVMLVPNRHVLEQELTPEEIAEFQAIKHSDEIQHTYDNFIESTHRSRSIPPHFHLHLMILKRFE